MEKDGKLAKEVHGALKALQKRYEKRLHIFPDAISKKPMGKNMIRLANYIMRFEEEWFTFLKCGDVDPTNNFVEKALHHVRIKRKTSQQSGGMENMESYAMQASVFMTLKQQDRSYSQYLANLLSNSPRSDKF